jgi:surfeit locus 1 family protein
VTIAAGTSGEAGSQRAAGRTVSREREKKQRSRAALLRLFLLALLCITALSALGVWQLERRVWKLALIQRVDERVHALPIPVPGPAEWPAITAARDEYLHVRVAGRFLNDRETLVRASTKLGYGFWVLTPMRTADGFTVLVNRGFVPSDRRDITSRAAGEIAGQTAVTGLLRMTEPKGGFLRANDPGKDLWYSRDVAAITTARGLTHVAPYFIDADEGANPAALPAGGQTVIAFPNNHLTYALTWFGLALTLAGATIYAARDERRLRSGR